MITGRVAANQKDKVRMLKVLEHERCSASAKRGIEADTARLMAVIGAIVDVVGPVEAGKELQQKSGFI